MENVSERHPVNRRIAAAVKAVGINAVSDWGNVIQSD